MEDEVELSAFSSLDKAVHESYVSESPPVDFIQPSYDTEDEMENLLRDRYPSTEPDSPAEPTMGVPERGVVKLQKSLTLPNTVAFVVGQLIGSGIFITPSTVLDRVGSFGLALIIWFIGAFIAIGGGLSYSELGTFFKDSGGEYTYIREAYSFNKKKPSLTIVGSATAFLYLWTSIIVRPASIAVITLAFGRYLSQAIAGGDEPPTASVKLLAISLMIVLGAINIWSLKVTAWLTAFLSLSKVLALGFIIVLGIWQLIVGEHLENFTDAFACITDSPGKIALAFYSVLWAYDGWNILSYTAEEDSNANKNIPRGIMIGIPIVSVCYVMVNVAFFAGLSRAELLSSEATGLTFGEVVLGKAGLIVIPLLVSVSTMGAANGAIYSASRLVFAAGRDGKLPEVLGCLHSNFKTPMPSTIFQVLLAAIFACVGSIDLLIDGFSVLLWIFYGLVFAGLLILRVTRRKEKRPFKVWIPVPCFMILLSVFLVITPMVYIPDQRVTSSIAIALTLLGLPIYFFLAWERLRLKIFDTISEKMTWFAVAFLNCSSTRPKPSSSKMQQ